MAYIEPTGKMWLCKDVPLNPSYEDTMTWNSIDEQRNYFISKTKWSSVKYTPIKERQGVLRVNGSVNKFYDCNYLMFENDNFYNPEYNWGEEKYNLLAPKKLFFAFITNVEYVNPETTLIHFQLDVMQTWWFEIEWERSLIEREHVKDDSLYANLEPENIQVNERIPYSNDFNLSTLFGDRILVIGMTENPNNIKLEGGVSILGSDKLPYTPYTFYPSVQKENTQNSYSSYIVYRITNSMGNTISNVSYDLNNECFWVDNSIVEFSFNVKTRVYVNNKKANERVFLVNAKKTGVEWRFSGVEVDKESIEQYDLTVVDYSPEVMEPYISLGAWFLKWEIIPTKAEEEIYPEYNQNELCFIVENNKTEFYFDVKESSYSIFENIFSTTVKTHKMKAIKNSENKWEFYQLEVIEGEYPELEGE